MQVKLPYSTQDSGEASVLEEGHGRHRNKDLQELNCDGTNINYNLESNNTHFFLFDHKPNDWESIIRKRHDIENELSCALKSTVLGYNQWTVFDDDIPIVALLLGGNVTTLRAICNHLKNGTPVVVVQGTGEVADIVTNITKFSNSISKRVKFDLNNWKSNFSANIYDYKSKLKMLLFSNENETIGDREILNCIDDLANNNELIVVFDPIGANGNLEGAIADAMLKRIYFRRQENDSYNYKLLAMELKWCLIWDKIDHARQNVFADHVFEKMSISQKMREFIKNLARTALFEALCRDNIHFVHLLMENGVSIKDLNIEQLTPEEFKMFCARILNSNALPLDKIPGTNVGINRKSSELAEIIYSEYRKQYLEDFIESGKKQKTQQSTIVSSDQASDGIINLFGENKIEKLYLWFLFMNRPEMAKFICSGHMVPPFQRSGTTAENKYLYLDLSWINFFASLANCICVLPFTLQGIFYQESNKPNQCRPVLPPELIYVLLIDYLPLNFEGEKRSGIGNLPIPISEIILHIYMLGFIIDEYHQFVRYKTGTHDYFSNVWNQMDLTGIICYLIAFITRCSWSLLPTNNQITWLYATSGSLINVTVASEDAVLWNWQLLRDIFNWGIWKVFGQVAEPFTNNATDMEVVSENDAYGTFVFLYAIAFVVISNVLLLNALIAAFNQTIEDVLEKSSTIWRYQQYDLTCEFAQKPPFPPPLNIMYYLVYFIVYPWRLTLCSICSPDKSRKLAKDNDEYNFYLINTEKQCAEMYWNSKSAIRDMQDVPYGRFKQLLLLKRPTDPQSIIPEIPVNARWAQNGVTVAGGHGNGNATNQLSSPEALFIDDDQTMFIVDRSNYRIIQWKVGDTEGQVVAGNNGTQNLWAQSFRLTDVLIDKETDSFIFCHQDQRPILQHANGRVGRWSRRSGTTEAEIVIDNICCYGLAMDDQRYLYVSDTEKHEVRRYQIGDNNGIIVAGGNGRGPGLNQLDEPHYVFVDRQKAVYVSDYKNHRVIKWNKGAKEGVIVAGGQGCGEALTQLYYPNGLFVDTSGTLYVVDSSNCRVMRWSKETKQGTVIAGGNRQGARADQFRSPIGLSVDQHGNLYVVDAGNNRVQRFSIE
ncbi:unnamed protein product [Rotaria socialis]|uniref:Ion transport domain-containing protein n=1 Tax=Rotaria socialis TaxID=392032 RepID=A0A821MJD3_9BILA|nr:unnamed protein product [Rotaria socialis]